VTTVCKMVLWEGGGCQCGRVVACSVCRPQINAIILFINYQYDEILFMCFYHHWSS
jgi:hypothetical protein